ncbi:hypothetical protein [Dyadobacter sp. CY312]|uniref:hypothetical protein n=1 Tax=Dyadobacter sp. CY312 TaxID=2907303 RepID=UPI001F42D0CB|nr:hypothetical protein [Dyadobacter sp. CY312]MCE7042674.1 hypothetical protein [Dyadobacter sp. CY312]
MKRFILCVSAMLPLFQGAVFAGESPDDKDKSAAKKVRLLRELPSHLAPVDSMSTGKEAGEFKPSIHVGAIVHMFASSEQSGFGGGASTDPKQWNKGFSLYRARVLVGGQLSKKGSFFMETDLPSPIGIQLGNGTKNVKVAPIMLDAQYEYDFSNAFQLIAGMQLVSNNRNGLQGAAGLMANDFTYFQYPYNLFENSPLQGNFGRDLGVNARGFLLKDKFEYRLGVFTGRNLDGQAPLRVVGRVAYNFLDPEKDYYYAGTKLGSGNTFAWGAGFDAQGSYYNLGTDVFIDKKAGNAGSVTLNAAFQYMTGGTNINSKYSFAGLIPRQNVQFLELGYYFNKSRLQPWVRYESQAISSKKEQAGSELVSDFDKAKSSRVYGGGLNYFFNGNTTNLRLSYVARQYNVASSAGDYNTKAYGQFWLQVQFFVF